VDLREGGLNLLSHAKNAGLRADVERVWMRMAAKRFDFGNEWRKVVCFAAGQNEVRTGARQCAGEVLTETTAGPSDERYLTGEIKQAGIFAHAGATSC
jgi:hypothetical protein